MWPQDQLHRAPVNDFPPLWASSWGDDEYGLWADLTITSNNTTATQKMRWIEPSQKGGFLIGSTKEERNKIQDKDIRKWANQYESEPFNMHIKNGFWLANTPCTQSFWTAVVGSNPSHFKNAPNAADLPVENIAFKNDENKEASVVHFLNLLNQNLQRIRSTQLNQQVLITADLPTETEWEYACRADTLTAFWWGDKFDEKKANTDNKLETTTPVLSYPPNPWGLYDIHGNVWEWTSSAWKNNLADESSIFKNNQKSGRGGAWRYQQGGARASYRDRRNLYVRSSTQGLRLLIRYST